AYEEEGVRVFQTAGLKDDFGRALALNDLGKVVLAHGQLEEGRRCYEQSLQIWRGINDRWGLPLTLSNLAALDGLEGQYTKARQAFLQALKIQDEEKDIWGVASSLRGLADVAADQEQFDQAAKYYYRSFKLHWELGRQRFISECLEGLATAAAGLSKPQWAAQLLGAAEKIRLTIGARMADYEVVKHDRVVDATRETLGVEAFAAACVEGEQWLAGEGAMSEQVLQQVTAYAQELTANVPDQSDDFPLQNFTV
ncbi:MAG: tetratricopeptide repeat protein, partial [Armatimonadota bacterium]|nr:tetratricopeptide repeat protein [Armatimonadota bacterium]